MDGELQKKGSTIKDGREGGRNEKGMKKSNITERNKMERHHKGKQ